VYVVFECKSNCGLTLNCIIFYVSLYSTTHSGDNATKSRKFFFPKVEFWWKCDYFLLSIVGIVQSSWNYWVLILFFMCYCALKWLNFSFAQRNLKFTFHRFQTFMKNTKSKELIFLFIKIFDNFIENSKIEKQFNFFLVFALFFEIFKVFF
jgi:hypothetical protein